MFWNFNITFIAILTLQTIFAEDNLSYFKAINFKFVQNLNESQLEVFYLINIE